MSFSSTVKNELSRIAVSDTCCANAELTAAIMYGSEISLPENKKISIVFTTENAAFARNIFTFLKNIYGIHPTVSIKKSKKLHKHTTYLITASDERVTQALKKINILRNFDKIISKTCCRKSFLRGAFLAAGSVSDPEKTYHLEICAKNQMLAEKVMEVLKQFELNAKIIKRKNDYVVYLKEGENIVDFLNIAGAHTALMELENIRIVKEMRNNINRIVNCETANLEKTVNASMRQLENIEFLKNTVGLENLPPNLEEIARLRLENPDANLKELGQMLTPPLGKSGVNHRLRKLDEIAENERILRDSNFVNKKI